MAGPWDLVLPDEALALAAFSDQFPLSVQPVLMQSWLIPAALQQQLHLRDCTSIYPEAAAVMPQARELLATALADYLKRTEDVDWLPGLIHLARRREGRAPGLPQTLEPIFASVFDLDRAARLLGVLYASAADAYAAPDAQHPLVVVMTEELSRQIMRCASLHLAIVHRELQDAVQRLQPVSPAGEPASPPGSTAAAGAQGTPPPAALTNNKKKKRTTSSAALPSLAKKKGS